MKGEPPNRPLYTLATDAAGCLFDVRINDCPVLSDSEGNAVTTNMPINQWLRNGANVLTLALERPPMGTGECKAEVLVGDVGSWPQPGYPIGSLTRAAPALPEGWDLPDAPPLWPPRVVKAHLTFRASLPGPPWRWDQAPPAVLLQSDCAAILVEARELWQALERRDRARVEQLFALRNRELGPARFQTPEERRGEFMGTMDDLLDPAEWRLMPLDEQDLEYRSYAHGRLVHLVDAVTGESPVFFTDSKQVLASWLDLFFFKDSDRKWRIIR